MAVFITSPTRASAPRSCNARIRAGAQQRLDRGVHMVVRRQRGKSLADVTGTPRDIARVATKRASAEAAR